MAELWKVNHDKNLDPDWGSIFPEEAHVVKVFVKRPKDKSIEPFYFLILIPDEGNMTSEVILAMVKELCNTFLEDGDHYSTAELTKEDLDNFKKDKNALPILSYDPRCTSSYFWLRPPAHLAN